MTTERFDLEDPAYTRALEAVRPELDAMLPADVTPIRYDIMTIVVAALGALPRVRPLRPLAAARFGEEAAGCIDRLETDARACTLAQARHLTTLHGTDVEEMAGRLQRVRSILLPEVRALVGARLLSPSVTAELAGGTSYKGLCLDVLQLVSALRSEWAAVSGRTGVTGAELDQAEALASAFSTVLGESEVGSFASPTAELRRRAYSRFVRTYGQVRRLVTFFRWEAGDADEVLPPLGAGRSRGADDEPPAPSFPGAPPGMPGASPLGAP